MYSTFSYNKTRIMLFCRVLLVLFFKVNVFSHEAKKSCECSALRIITILFIYLDEMWASKIKLTIVYCTRKYHRLTRCFFACVRCTGW